MNKSIQRGFTLIELLVVIAIIGILAGILFVAIDPTKQTRKADAAAVKASLAGIPTAALTYWDNHDFGYGSSNTDNVCQDAGIKQIWDNLDGGVCNQNTSWTNYAVSAEFKKDDGSTDHYCVDSTGFRGIGKTATVGVCS